MPKKTSKSKPRKYHTGIGGTDGRCNMKTVNGERCKNPSFCGLCKYHQNEMQNIKNFSPYPTINYEKLYKNW